MESRCGILCGGCPFRRARECGGCVEIQKPFWGESCPIKTCCEGRGLDHCGQCGDFPCGLLKQFAYDPEQGDDGRRIAQCEAWRKERD